MDRSDLHRLVDTLPEGAFEHAKRVLEHLQVWPPQPPPETERMRQIRREPLERMRQSMRTGTMGGGGAIGFMRPDGYGHHSYSLWEDRTAVMVSHHFYKGHEIGVTERLRFTDDGEAIRYIHEATGPKGDTRLTEMTFPIR